jgi:uncharacterized protein
VAGGKSQAIHRTHVLTIAEQPVEWHRYDSQRHMLTLEVRVQPNASRTEIAGLHDGRLKIRVAAPPVDDRANAMLLEFLKTKLDLRGCRVMIRHGGRGRSKTIDISQPGPALLDSVKRLLQP